MSHRALPSTTFSAALRARLGISQQELGDFLGVGEAQVGHVEAGRRGYTARAQMRLHQLAELVPAEPTPEPPAAAEPPAGLTAAEAQAARARLRTCRYEARQLRYQQATWPGRTTTLGLRRHTAATLQAALRPLAADDPEAHRAREWLALLELATKRTARLVPTPGAQALLALRLHLLDAEAAALEQLLGGPPSA